MIFEFRHLWGQTSVSALRMGTQDCPYISFCRTLNPNLVQRTDLETIARPDDRRRSIFFDDRGTSGTEASRQRISVKNLRVDPAAGVADINSPRLRRRCFCRRTRQASNFRLLQARESAQMQGLKFSGCLGIRMTIASLVIAFEGDAYLLLVLQARDRNLDIVPLAAVAHFRVALEKNIAGGEFGSQRNRGFLFHRSEYFRHGRHRLVVEHPDESFRSIDPRVGQKHADRREIAGLGRNDDGGNRKLVRQGASMERSAAAIAEKDKVARIETMLDGNFSNRAGHDHRDD